ncbi:MAG: LrgB family protein [Betaproteobacteria bacterium]|nr:LrgB family protein [Betaproteobacteria bacterium]
MPLIAQASGEQAEGIVRIGGFAAGLTAHGIGTTRAYQVSNEAGVYAALALAFAALLQGIVLPLVL